MEIKLKDKLVRVQENLKAMHSIVLGTVFS